MAPWPATALAGIGGFIALHVTDAPATCGVATTTKALTAVNAAIATSRERRRDAVPVIRPSVRIWPPNHVGSAGGDWSQLGASSPAQIVQPRTPRRIVMIDESPDVVVVAACEVFFGFSP